MLQPGAGSPTQWGSAYPASSCPSNTAGCALSRDSPLVPTRATVSYKPSPCRYNLHEISFSLSLEIADSRNQDRTIENLLKEH